MCIAGEEPAKPKPEKENSLAGGMKNKGAGAAGEPARKAKKAKKQQAEEQPTQVAGFAWNIFDKI